MKYMLQYRSPLYARNKHCSRVFFHLRTKEWESEWVRERERLMKVIRKPNRFYYYLFNLLIAHSVHHHTRSNSFTIDKKSMHEVIGCELNMIEKCYLQMKLMLNKTFLCDETEFFAYFISKHKHLSTTMS